MNIVEPLAGLQLNDHAFLNDKIESVFTDSFLIVENTHGFLPLTTEIAFPKFNHQSFLVDFFEKARSKFTMHVDAASNNPL